MIATDEDALICDFAETYHIYNYRGLPVSYVAALACGLRPESRIKMAINDSKVKPDTLLLASIMDKLSLLLWLHTNDGVNGRNRPPSIVAQLLGSEENTNGNVVGFDDGEAFEQARKQIIERAVNADE